MRKFLVKMGLFIIAFGFVFALTSCKDPDEGDKTEDKIAPLLEVKPESIELFSGDAARDYDPMTGVTARDDVDGTITSSVNVDKGNFDPDTPGTYTFTYTVEDKAGNKSSATRTVVVVNVTSAVKVGDAYTTNFVVNPQLIPQYVGASFGFDLTKVQIFSKEYVEWIMENYPERFATLWGAVVVIDADGKVVHSRYLWNNVGLDEEGVQVTFTNDTLTWVNYPDHASSDPKLYKYRPITTGGMLGDILRFIPDGGHVLVGVNGHDNGEGTPKKFFEDHVVNINDNGLGKVIDITTINTDFDENDTWPIIFVPYENVEMDKSTAHTETKIVLSPGDEYDVLEGVTAKSAAGADITDTITYKIYPYSSMTDLVVTVPGIDRDIKNGNVYFTEDPLDEIDLSEMEPGDPVRRFMVEYTVVDPDNNKVDKSWRLYEVVPPAEPTTPNKIIFGDVTEEVRYNDTLALVDEHGSGINMRLDAYNDSTIYVYSRRGFLAALADPDVNAGSSANGGMPLLPWSVVVVVDKDGKVVQFRNWTKIYNGAGEDISADYPDALATAVSSNKHGLLADLEDVIPVDGHLIVFPVTAAGAIRLKGLQIFWNPTITASNDLVTERSVDWTESVVEVKPNHIETISAFYGLEEKVIHFNNKSSLVSSGGNIAMRFANDGVFFVYSKEGYLAALADETVSSSNEDNGGLPYLPWGAVAIFNADGTIVLYRVDKHGQYNSLGEFTTYTEAGYDDLKTNDGGGLLTGLDALIPDGGYIVIFPFTGANDQKLISKQLLWNEEGNLGSERTLDWSKPILKIQELGQFVAPFELTWFEEEFEDTIYNAIINDKQYHVTVDDEAMWAHDPSGYNFVGRTEANSHFWHIVTKENIDLISERKMEWLGLVIVANADGTIHHFRVAGKDANDVAINKVVTVVDGVRTIKGVDDALWGNGVAPTNANSLENVANVIPDGGFIIVLPGHFGHHMPIYNALMEMTDEEFATHSFLKETETDPGTDPEPAEDIVQIGSLEIKYTINDEAMWAEDPGYSFVGRSETGNTQFHVVTKDQLSLVEGKASNWGGMVVVANADGTINHIRYTKSGTYIHNVVYFDSEGVRATANSTHELWGNGVNVAVDHSYNAMYNATVGIPDGGFIVVATDHGSSLATNVYDALMALTDAELVDVFKQIIFE